MAEISDKSSEARFMNATIEASHCLKRLALPAPAGDSVKAALRRAGLRLDGWCRANGVDLWTANRLKDVWHVDRRISVSAEELEQLRAANAVRERGEADARDEVRQIYAGIALLVERLAQIDPEFHSQTMSSFRKASHADE